jgi:hypothetical protein
MAVVKFGGKEWPSLRALCRVFGKSISTVHERMKQGMSLKDALYETNARSHKFTVNGQRLPTKEAAKALGIAPSTLRKRRTDGWKQSEVVLPRLYPRGVTAFGRTQSITAWAREYGMNRDCLRYRLRSGMQPELALTLPVEKRKPRKESA